MAKNAGKYTGQKKLSKENLEKIQIYFKLSFIPPLPADLLKQIQQYSFGLMDV